MILPKEVVEASPCIEESFRSNEYAIVSHFDTYQTIIQLMSMTMGGECPREGLQTLVNGLNY